MLKETHDSKMAKFHEQTAMTLGIVERTVNSKQTIRFCGCTYYGETEHDRSQLNLLIGKRVFVQQANFWGTKINVARHKFLPGLSTINMVLEP